MSYKQTESHDDLLTLNGFRVEIDGKPVQDIVAVGGINRTVGVIEWTDGGTGFTENFSDQRKVHGPISLRYFVDPTRGDFDKLHSYVTASHLLGVRFDFVIVKYNHGIEVFRIPVYRALFQTETFPELDKNGAGPFEVSLELPCAYWEITK